MEVFDRRNARADRLAEFLAIYVQHFGPEHRTPTNELIEFLEAPPADRTITYFGLTYDNQPCGFATLMFYPDGPIGIIDHLVVAPNLRGYGGFFSFCDLIARHLEGQRISFDHIVAEVMLNERHVASTIKPTLLLRLMRLVGFRIAKTAYWAPDPSIVTDAKGCRAALLFASRPERDELPSSEFIRLVELIYRVHYAGWYQRTMPGHEFDRYKSVADQILGRVRSAVANEARVVLNGMKNLDLPFSVDANAAASPSTLFYIAVVAIPAAVGIAVALAQELWVTILAATLAVALIGIFAIHPRLRRLLMRAFRLAE
ncbi:hypothetical protein [Bosea sp. (in: a-proteobacteria)]|uniref:hypothetical protein n=1 Tax=Bosea sp. (in: a-proteobacteria) TaxID=1871050 RepID=UPI0012143E32|nr:hypothetical protein [Bosea sp. (in: a-proteobacteria)]TAJ33644.1 MAG: hypothetical protein EPO59_04555 [Bosea sp. (in: a-proteobacteria)]